MTVSYTGAPPGRKLLLCSYTTAYIINGTEDDQLRVLASLTPFVQLFMEPCLDLPNLLESLLCEKTHIEPMFRKTTSLHCTHPYCRAIQEEGNKGRCVFFDAAAQNLFVFGKYPIFMKTIVLCFMREQIPRQFPRDVYEQYPENHTEVALKAVNKLYKVFKRLDFFKQQIRRENDRRDSIALRVQGNEQTTDN